MIEASKLEKGFEGRVLIDGLSFTLPRNGIVGVIGPNGVGKTTLFKTIVGLEPLDAGNLKVARPSTSPTSTRVAAESTPTRRCGRS